MQQSATDGFIAFHRFGLVKRHRGRQYFGEESLERVDQIPNTLNKLNVANPPPGEPQTSIDFKFSPDFTFFSPETIYFSPETICFSPMGDDPVNIIKTTL